MEEYNKVFYLNTFLLLHLTFTESLFASHIADNSYSAYLIIFFFTLVLTLFGGVSALPPIDVDNSDAGNNTDARQEQDGSYCDICKRKVEYRFFHSTLTGRCVSDYNAMKLVGFFLLEIFFFIYCIYDYTYSAFRHLSHREIYLQSFAFLIISLILIFFLIQCIVYFIQLCYIISYHKNVVSTKSIIGIKYYQLSNERSQDNSVVTNWKNILLHSEDMQSIRMLSKAHERARLDAVLTN